MQQELDAIKADTSTAEQLRVEDPLGPGPNRPVHPFSCLLELQASAALFVEVEFTGLLYNQMSPSGTTVPGGLNNTENSITH